MGQALSAGLGAAATEALMPHLNIGNSRTDQLLGSLIGGSVSALAGGRFDDGAISGGFAESFNRQLHQGEYNRANELSQNEAIRKKLSELEGREVTEEELLGRVTREMLRHRDFDTFMVDGQVSDYLLNSVIGGNTLCGDCRGALSFLFGGEDTKDPYYYDTQVNAELIEDNLETWALEALFNQSGKTREGLVTDNVENNPMTMTILGAQLQALGVMTGSWAGIGLKEMAITGMVGGCYTVGTIFGGATTKTTNRVCAANED